MPPRFEVVREHDERRNIAAIYVLLRARLKRHRFAVGLSRPDGVAGGRRQPESAGWVSR